MTKDEVLEVLFSSETEPLNEDDMNLGHNLVALFRDCPNPQERIRRIKDMPEFEKMSAGRIFRSFGVAKNIQNEERGATEMGELFNLIHAAEEADVNIEHIKIINKMNEIAVTEKTTKKILSAFIMMPEFPQLSPAEFLRCFIIHKVIFTTNKKENDKRTS